MDSEAKPGAHHVISDKAARTAGRRARQGLWGVIGCLSFFALPLLVVAVMYGVEFYRCTRFEPTGDALYDRYARTLINHHAWRFYLTMEGVPDPSKLPWEVVISWQDEFGDDPRYWELLWRCASDRKEHYAEIDPSGGVEGAYSMIRFLAEEHSVTPALAYEMWRGYSPRWYDAVPMQVDADESTDVRARQALERERQLVEKFPEKVISSFDIVIEADPGNSYGYYRRAMAHYAGGDLENALADLRAGNAAPSNYWRMPFPYSQAITNWEQGTVAGNPALGGRFFTEIASVPNDNSELIKGISRNIASEAAASGDRELLDAWFHSLCRHGAMEKGDTVNLLVMIVCLRDMSKLFLTENAEQLSTEQRADLLHLHDRTLTISSDFRRTLGQLDMYEQVHGDLFELAEPSRGYFMSKHYRYLDDYSQVEFANRQKLRDKFEELSDFSYLTFRFPEEVDED